MAADQQRLHCRAGCALLPRGHDPARAAPLASRLRGAHVIPPDIARAAVRWLGSIEARPAR